MANITPVEVNFKVAYDGQAVQAGTMSVRDLAPALMAMSDLFDEANRQVQGEDGPGVNLKFKAVGKGSFEVELALSYGLIEALIDFFTSEAVTALAGLMTLLGIGTGFTKGLMWLIKKIRGRNITEVEMIEER